MNNVVTAVSYLSATQNRIFAGVIRMVLRRNLKYSWHGGSVWVNDVPDKLGYILVDQDDVDVVALHEPLETVLDLAHWSVWGWYLFSIINI